MFYSIILFILWTTCTLDPEPHLEYCYGYGNLHYLKESQNEKFKASALQWCLRISFHNKWLLMGEATLLSWLPPAWRASYGGSVSASSFQAGSEGCGARKYRRAVQPNAQTNALISLISLRESFRISALGNHLIHKTVMRKLEEWRKASTFLKYTCLKSTGYSQFPH